MEETTKKKKGCLMPVIVILMLVAMGLTLLTNDLPSYKDVVADMPAQPAFIEAEKFSKISESQLVTLLGEPSEKEDWKNTISESKSHALTMYHYTVGDVCTEYNFCKNAAGEKILVYIGIKFDYSGEGSNLGVGLNETILPRLGITPQATMKNVANTGVAIRWESVSDKVETVWAMSLDSNSEMVDQVKIIFDSIYET